MRTIEQIQKEIEEIKKLKVEDAKQQSSIRAKREVVNTLSGIISTAEYRFKGSNEPIYEEAYALFPIDLIKSQISTYEKDIENYSGGSTDLLRKERDLENKIYEINKNSLTTDELLEIRNKISSPTNYSPRYYYNLSNYKKSTLFNQSVLSDAVFIVKIEGTRKADTLIEAGFFESKLYVNILKMSTKMRTTYILSEESEDVQVEMALYDSKSETFQKLGTLPSLKKDSFYDEFMKGI